MKLHEYQARELLADFGIPVPGGDVADNSHDAEKIAELYNGRVVVKAQVLMGGRGKAGGVKAFDSAIEAGQFARDLLGKKLVSEQNPQGMVVEKVLVVERLDIEKEFYIAILLDRAAQKNVIMLSAMGGMDIEQVALEHPQAIVKLHVDPKWGLCQYEIRDAIADAGIDFRARKQMLEMIAHLYDSYVESDATLIEVNPCVLTTDGKLLAADAKITIDDNALFRHPSLAEIADDTAENPLEAEAARRGIAYVKLDGDVGVIGNGAGLVMLTIDEIARAGRKAANFLDVGGGAQAERVKDCIELVLMDRDVRALLINIFGGITRGDEVANGLVDALKSVDVRIPIVVRIEGTNAEAARATLAGAKLIAAESVQEAAQKVASLLA